MSSTKYQFSGRCACGSIHYQCTSLPEFSLICQCRQCQRITGTGHAAQFAMCSESITIQGDVQTFNYTSDEGNTVTSAFCGHCGNPVYKTTTMMPEFFVFHAGTLDNPDQYQPEMVVFSKSGQQWDHVDPALPRQ